MAVKTINSVRNALTVIEALASAQPVGVSALARLVDMDKAAVQRILLTLGDSGWLRQSESGEWTLTSRALQVGATYTAGLRDLARPHLVGLQQTTDETSLLFAREGSTLVLIDSIDSRHPLRMSVPLGTAVPIVQSGALDAFLSDSERESLPLLDGRPPSDALQAAVRRQGFYVVDQIYPNSVAVGAPIFGAGRAIVGSVLVVGPTARMPRPVSRRYGDIVTAAATSISDALSGDET